MRLIDANKLMEYCKNNIDRTIDCNDIARFPIVHAVPIEVLQEIRHEIETAQTYKIASGSHDLYIDRYNALEIIDSHIEQYKGE